MDDTLAEVVLWLNWLLMNGKIFHSCLYCMDRSLISAVVGPAFRKLDGRTQAFTVPRFKCGQCGRHYSVGASPLLMALDMRADARANHVGV